MLNLDIPPSLLDLANIQVPGDMQGRSMRPLLAGKKSKKDWRKEVYYHYYEKSFGLTAHYGILTKRYKLIHFYDPIDAWELYDLKKNPEEMHNCYDDPKYRKTIGLLNSKLRALQIYYKDPVK